MASDTSPALDAARLPLDQPQQPTQTIVVRSDVDIAKIEITTKDYVHVVRSKITDRHLSGDSLQRVTPGEALILLGLIHMGKMAEHSTGLVVKRHPKKIQRSLGLGRGGWYGALDSLKAQGWIRTWSDPNFTFQLIEIFMPPEPPPSVDDDEESEPVIHPTMNASAPRMNADYIARAGMDLCQSDKNLVIHPQMNESTAGRAETPEQNLDSARRDTLSAPSGTLSTAGRAESPSSSSSSSSYKEEEGREIVEELRLCELSPIKIEQALQIPQLDLRTIVATRLECAHIKPEPKRLNTIMRNLRDTRHVSPKFLRDADASLARRKQPPAMQSTSLPAASSSLAMADPNHVHVDEVQERRDHAVARHHAQASRPFQAEQQDTSTIAQANQAKRNFIAAENAASLAKRQEELEAAKAEKEAIEADAARLASLAPGRIDELIDQLIANAPDAFTRVFYASLGTEVVERRAKAMAIPSIVRTLAEMIDAKVGGAA